MNKIQIKAKEQDRIIKAIEEEIEERNLLEYDKRTIINTIMVIIKDLDNKKVDATK